MRGRPDQGIDLFTDEMICFRRYLRAIFHVRPKMRLSRAYIQLDGQTIPLEITEQDDFLLLTADALIPGIASAHEATVTLLPAGFGARPVVFGDLVTGDLLRHDPFHRLSARLRVEIEPRLSDWRVLEIGSRTRGATLGAWDALRSCSAAYVGMDIVPGPNVDIVGDAHVLSSLVGGHQFDFIYSQNVFEHLAMPWVVATEMNRVLRMGAEAFLISNHTIALHDLPWDFFRFSESAWHALFNPGTGFEVIETALGEAMRLTPMRYHRGFIEHEAGAGFQASAVLIRKIAERPLIWPVGAKPVLDGLSRAYPVEITD